jgi:cardiolipin synthase
MARAARKAKVRSIDTSAMFRRLARRDLLAGYISARKARMITAVAILVFLAWFLVFLLQPAPAYRLSDGRGIAIGTPEYLRMLEALADSHFDRRSTAEVFTNGESYYPAELEAIRNAKRSVNLEAYIFKPGRVGQQFVDALTERARAGVKVNVLVDGVGSFLTRKAYFQPLVEAGGRVEWYHPVGWTTWLRYNKRTHRELLVVDGEVAFAGGAGIADHWLHGEKDHPRWRDTMFRFRGEAVNSLQGTFVENWVEACGEVLNTADYFPAPPAGEQAVLVVNSTPSQGNATRARVLYEVLLGSATRRIYITTPYFLPDKGLVHLLVTAKRDRHLDVKVLVPGKRSDHAMTRSSSRGLYGKLLEAGVEIYEYQPSMLHAKVMLVDDDWTVVGSTNFDNRSFGINDELSVAVRDAALAERLTADFERDLAQSERVTMESWKDRPVWQRGFEWAGWLLSRHQ